MHPLAGFPGDGMYQAQAGLIEMLENRNPHGISTIGCQNRS